MAKPKDVSMRSYKNKTLLQKFEVAELGNLAGTGPAWLVRRLSYRLHQPLLHQELEAKQASPVQPQVENSLLDAEGAKFLKMCLTAIDEGNPDFFIECSKMVEFIKKKMDEITPEERRRMEAECKAASTRRRDAALKNIRNKTGTITTEEREGIEAKCKSQSQESLRATIWMEAMKPMHVLGYNILHTLLALSRIRGREAKVQQSDLMTGLQKCYPRCEGYDDSSIRVKCIEMGFPKFPIPLAEFWDLEHEPLGMRNRIVDALVDLAKKRKRATVIELPELLESLRRLNPRAPVYEDRYVLETLKVMGLKGCPLPLADFWDLQNIVPSLHETLHEFARENAPATTVSFSKLIRALRGRHRGGVLYEEDHVLNALRLMGIQEFPIPLAGFGD